MGNRESSRARLAAMCCVSLALLAGPAHAGAELAFLTGPFAAGNAGPVALADFNGDGHLDAVISDPGDLVVKVRLGDGAGGLGDPVFSAALPVAGNGPVAAGDLNGDGIPDFAVGYGTFADSNPRVAVFFSNGAGGFAAGPVLPVVDWPGSIAIGDLNGDGAADLAVGSNNGGSFSVVLGTGGGAFGTHTPYTAGSRPYSVLIADLNHDSKPDIVAAAIDSHGVYVLLGNGDGTFSAYDSFITGSFPVSLAGADIDGDGHLDLATAIPNDNRVALVFGDGLGGFSAPAFVTVAQYVRGVLFRDFNGDGRPDLVVSTEFNGGVGSNAVYTLRNLGARTFDTPVPLFQPGGSYIAPPELAAGDVNGDRRADLVIADTTPAPPFGSGDRIWMFLNATAFPARRSDFDGDLRSDILWRNSSTGENYLYPMNGTAILGSEGYVRTVADQNWQVAGTGDFDGDGKADVLWRNSGSGENYVYLMNGKVIAGEGYLRTVDDQNWQVAGVEDINGDGKADILWRNNATGENYLYPMNGLAILGTEGYLRTVADLNWTVAGVGDLDGDGKADVVWRNAATGENYLYPMNGTTILGTEGYLRTVADLNWRIAGTGDFDGDGRSDVLWRNSSTGENYLYPMNGTTILGTEGYLRTVPDQSWQVKGTGDYDGNGKSDVLWRHAMSGENYLYPMDGTTILGTEGYLRTVADADWTIAGGPLDAPLPAAGTYGISPSIQYSCFFGLVDLNVTSFVFTKPASQLNVVGSPAWSTQAMAGSETGNSFSVQRTDPGGATLTYALSGTFAPDRMGWSGTFQFACSGSCNDCSNQQFSVTATRE